MGIAYLIFLLGYLLFSIFLIWLVRRIFRQHRFRMPITWLTVALVVLFPTYDVIIQLSLLKYYDLTRQPLQRIVRTVDAPGSVYWEDNVWPGYDENYRLWMIDHLLDGEHLDTLAMNGPDGKIYLYRYGQGDTPEVFNSAADLPPVNYHVVLNPVPLWFWQRPFIWADRIEIVDNRTKELIAYSERYLGYSLRAYVVKPIGGSPFEGGGAIGEKNIYIFDDLVVFKYRHKFASIAEVYRSEKRKFSTNTAVRLYLDNKNRRGKNE